MENPTINIHSLPVGTIAKVFFPRPINPELDEKGKPYWGRWLKGRFLWKGTEPPNVRSLSLIDDPIFNTGDPCLDVIGIYQEQIESGSCQILIEKTN